MSVTWNSSKQSSQDSCCDLRRGEAYGILAVVAAGFGRRAKAADPLVHIEHELVEMDAALAQHRRGLEEQVHEHGLAAPDIAIKVEAFVQVVALLTPGGKQPAERVGLAAQAMLAQPFIQRAEECQQLLLRRITLDLAGGNQHLVAGSDIGGHDRATGGLGGGKALSREP